MLEIEGFLYQVKEKLQEIAESLARKILVHLMDVFNGGAGRANLLLIVFPVKRLM